jgi:hypothetical protein
MRPWRFSPGLLAIAALAAAGPAQAPKQPFVRGTLTTFNDNGGWSWFEDERAVVDRARGLLLVSSVANGHGAGGADRHGDVELVAYDLATGAARRVTLHHGLEGDDHNSAALLVRPDGRYLAAYSRHNSDRLTRWRVSSRPGDAIAWGPERTFDNDAGTTYSNLHRLAAENGGRGRVYNFTRTVGFDPNVLVSDDDGSTWAYGGRLLDGPGRPYLKYASDGRRRVHFITTEQHPRNFDNGIHHGYVEAGKVHRSDGAVADDNLFDGEAVAPTALTRVFAGGSEAVAWTTDLHLDSAGRPYAAFSIQKDGAGRPPGQGGMDHRYYYARFDGARWHVLEMSHAGRRLYPGEDDYTGLAALDPHDPSRLFISTDTHPAIGAPLVSAADGRRHHEIFEGKTAGGGATWAWRPVTADSTADNIRPVVPAWGEGRTALLWLRGTYTTYTKYDLAVVGIIMAGR